MTINRDTVAEMANRYSDLGIKLIPVHGIDNGICTCGNAACKSIGKHPIEKDWPARASFDKKAISRWLRDYKEVNIGIPTGRLNGITVLDIDPRNDGNTTLEKLEKKLGKLPQGCVAESGGAGWHYIVRYVENSKSKSTWKGIDVKSDGGFIVVAPSQHKSGRAYRWLTDLSNLSSPPSLGDRWRSEITSASVRKGRPTDEWVRILTTKIEEGSRNQTLASFVGYLLAHELDLKVVLILANAINSTLFQPPLSQTEMIRVVTSIVRTHASTQRNRGRS